MSEASTTSVSPPAEATAVAGIDPIAGKRGPEAVRDHAAAFLLGRGVGPVALTVFALAFAATSGFVFLLDHPGLGGALGLVALLAAELSLVPPVQETRDSADLVRGLNPLADLMIAAGIVGGAAVRQPPAVFGMALVVFVLLAWLPLVKERGGPARMAVASSLWSRGERMAILLLGAMLGRLAPAMAVLILVGALDAWLRVERLAQPAGFEPQIGPKFARQVLQPDGSFVPAVRWGSLAVTVILLFLLPQSAGWRF